MAILRDVKRALPKKAIHIEHYDVRRSFYKLGDTTVLHGFKYNINAIRDTAKTYGRVLMGHVHRCASQPADRIDGAVGYCVGYLGDPDKFEYAHQRQAMLEWNQGFAWGEYCDDFCQINLCAKTPHGWRMPL